MIAYNGNKKTKSDILKVLRAHAKADEFVKGQYWENGKGCAVGCTIKSRNHSKYEPLFGIPQALAKLEDVIFEGLPNARAKEWPVQFMSSIKTGSDLSKVQWKFLYWLLTDEKVNPGINHPLVKAAVSQCAEVVWGMAEGKSAAESAAARSAESAAWSAASAARSAESAAWSAESAARSAAGSAAWSAAESAAESAARSAARSAESAAWSAESAESAARSAASAWSAESAESAAYVLMADKLIQLLKEAK